jgi:capping protein alpha
MSDDEYEEASPEQQRTIARYFIMSSPTGEVDEVVNDVKTLIKGDDVLGNDDLTKIMSNYNTDQMVVAKGPDGNNLMVTTHGQVDQNLFLDPSTGRVHEFNHISRKFADTPTDKKQELDDKVAKYRAAMQKAAEDYASSSFKKNKCTAAVYGANDGALTICLSAANISLGNFWTGGWRSVYQLNISSSGSTTIKGNCKTNVHYYEDGNVQLHAGTDCKLSCTVGDAEATATEVMKLISQHETKWQTNLESMYVKMHDQTFKSMRRFLPISKKLMNWNLAAVSLASAVAAK